MAFIPDTQYRINNSGTWYNSFFEAVSKTLTMPDDTTVTNSSGAVVFTKDGSSKTYYLYQYNVPYGKASELSYSGNQLIPGAPNDDEGKMRTWLNNFAYSQAIDGTGALSNSRIRPFYINKDVYLNSLYLAQEKASGGYYNVRTLSSGFTGLENKAARVTVKLSNIKTNLTSKDNAYVLLGMHIGPYTLEIGLQLGLENGKYKWFPYISSSYEKDENGDSLWTHIGNGAIGSINCGTEVTLEIIKTGTHYETQVYLNGKVSSDIPPHKVDIPGNLSHGFFRMISLCPSDSNTNLTPNLNSGEYFSGASFKDCDIKRGTDTVYQPWNYNADFNEFAAAFNDQFIEVTPSTETVSISYKGRDLNNNLILS